MPVSAHLTDDSWATRVSDPGIIRRPQYHYPFMFFMLFMVKAFDLFFAAFTLTTSNGCCQN